MIFDSQPPPNFDLRGYPPLLRHILDGDDYLPLLASACRPKHQADWRTLMKRLAERPPRDRALAESFHTQWHVSHHRIRELVDDDTLLMDMLWVWLPRYEGPDLLLFRGENVDRHAAGHIGTAWTADQETARIFAEGNNAVGSGGLILRTTAPASAIIAGPSHHSRYLDESEFSLDTRRLAGIDVVKRYPGHR